MKKLMLSCHTATELMEKKLRGNLTFRERSGLFVHTLMCDACRRYEKQSLFLERLFNAKDQREESGLEELAHALEKKILGQLDKKE